jgi:glutathione S-transferase
MRSHATPTRPPVQHDAPRQLHCLWLCPFSRTVRLGLEEKGLAYRVILEKPWERRREFLALNPAAQVPVLREDSGITVPDSEVISDYLDEAYPQKPLIGADIANRVEVRRLHRWFSGIFFEDVTKPVLYERVFAPAMGRHQPDAKALKVCFDNLKQHLEYTEYLLESNHWIAGQALSWADLAAGAHFSCLDYLNLMAWEKYPATKLWYMRLKSRPSFRPILKDKAPHVPASAHYENLDW